MPQPTVAEALTEPSDHAAATPATATVEAGDAVLRIRVSGGAGGTRRLVLAVNP